jgi:hypothetical protein
MEIFGRILSGDDAKAFCKLSNELKREWIAKYTKQTNEELITDFLTNPPKQRDCGCGCGGNKSKTNGNITSGISSKVTESAEFVSDSGHDETNSNKRQRKSKGQKD